MQIKELNENDLCYVIESYIKHRKEFVDLCTLEDFSEQYCHRCDTCGKVICVLDMCEECNDNQEFDKDFEYFDREKEHYVYGL